jgi:hypothetical protein
MSATEEVCPDHSWARALHLVCCVAGVRHEASVRPEARRPGVAEGAEALKSRAWERVRRGMLRSPTSTLPRELVLHLASLIDFAGTDVQSDPLRRK